MKKLNKRAQKIRKFVLGAGLVLSIGIFVFSLATRQVFAAVAVVSPANMQGWAFDVQSPDGIGTFVTGPATPPLGVGSARLFTGTNGNSAVVFHNVSYTNVNLSNITRLDYSTYSVSNAAGSKFPILKLEVNNADVGSDELTFNPQNQTQTPQLNTWQTWQTVNGFWTSSQFGGNFAGGKLSEYLTFISGYSSQPVTIVNKPDNTGGVRIQAGPGGSGETFDENVDNFTIGISGADMTYDFEPDVVPTSKDQCKNGGWLTFHNPAFKNQGDCINFVK